MNWLWLLSYFFGGAFAENAIPHIVAGVTGRTFPTPFAKPPGKGLSSSKINVVWGFVNMAIAYGLVAQVGLFDWQQASHVIVFGLGFLLKSVGSAHQFGKVYGGNAPLAAERP